MVRTTMRRRAILALVLLGFLTVGTLALRGPETGAAPAGNCTYYNNANHTQVVGQFGYDCCNNRVAWGRTSSYYTCGGCFICYPPPR
jgi:hypothetical protein